MTNSPDIFDKIMGLPVLRIFKPFYTKNKEILLYLFFGFSTTVVNFATLWLCNSVFGINEIIANTIAWVVGVAFAFITNKTFVFNSHTHGFTPIVKEALAFSGGRFVTLVTDNLLIFIFVSKMGINLYIIKVISEIIVIILNYIFSKLIFKNKSHVKERI